MTLPRCTVELCLGLDGSLLLIAGWLLEPAAGVTLRLAGAPSFSVDLTPELVRLPRPDVLAALVASYPAEVLAKNPLPGFIALATGVPLDAKLALSVGIADEAALSVELAPRAFAGSLEGSSREYLRHSLGPWLDVLRRHDLLGNDAVRAFVASLGPEAMEQAARLQNAVAGDDAEPGVASDSDELQVASSLPAHVESAADRIAAAIDHVYLLPGGVFVAGWLVDADDTIRSLRLHHADVAVDTPVAEMIRLSRPDVEQNYGAWCRERASDRFGIAFHAELPGSTLEELEKTLHFTLMTAEGPCRRAGSLRPSRAQTPPPNPMPVIREILTMTPPGDVRALFKHLGPAVESLWKHRAALRETPLPSDVGEPIVEPAVSVIIPVYGRHDLVEYQLAQFADDPDFRSVELIYVVVDPRIGNDVESLCRDVHPLFRVPCRVILCAQNHGFAGATNIGAAAARGRLLLLLNSDVMPKQRGWLGRLRNLHDALPNRGALAPKLLFPDGSIQHVGIAFEQRPNYPGLWLHTHPDKGYPSRSEASTTAVPVAAVTTACLLVERELYREVGGLDEGYIIGEVEDSDFCLKLRARGAGSYYAPGVELYHLELRAQNLEGSTEWRASLNLYNAWRMTLRWGEEIEKLSRSQG